MVKWNGKWWQYFPSGIWDTNKTRQGPTNHREIDRKSKSPFPLPREFGQLFVCLVYIPTDANDKAAADSIHQHIQDLETASPDTPKLVLGGDFNGCSMSTVLPHYQQHVKCATRGSKTIDLCYGNIRNAYRATSKPPIGKIRSTGCHHTATQKRKAQSYISAWLPVWDPDS